VDWDPHHAQRAYRGNSQRTLGAAILFDAELGRSTLVLCVYANTSLTAWLRHVPGVCRGRVFSSERPIQAHY